MAGSLEGVLARVPGLGGYVAGQQMGQRDESQKLAQLGALQQIMQRQQQAQMAQQNMGREQAYRAALQGLGPNPTQEALAGVASQFGSPDKVMDVQQRSLDRQTQMKVEAAKLVQQHQFKLDEIKQRSTDDRAKAMELLAERQAFEERMKKFMVDNRPAPQVQPLVAIIDPVTKQQRLVERKDAVGMVPAGTGAKAEAVEAGKTDVDNAVVTLKSALDSLNEGGGITSTDKGVLPNVGRWASTTGPGQLLGTMGGTVNQKNRDVIAQARPLLLRSIMQATGMSAKAMDSNAELKLWLSTATDPTKGYEANVEALNNIATKYGSGGFMGQTSDGKITKNRRADDVPAGVDPKVWGAMKPEEKKLFKP